MGTGVSLRCINPIQRYGSEGAGVGSEYLTQPSGYNSYHHGSAQRLRNVVIPPPPRPRDTGAGSTNVLCYTKPSSPIPAFNSSENTLSVETAVPVGRYVNITEAGGRPLLERDGNSSPRPLNYAEVGIGTEPERVPSRCSSVGQRPDGENGITVNYTLIDAERTRALQAANAANGERRRNPTGH
ncbi:unnamed protein product [Strongylus vulgaris]|uniref:Uncharacterized protein n=1 Tax=Strongylus vulgaris TaxID=40348 RepID=A0A3P7JHN2_STRVU|nr:unnamed protein product [Strongylus vulgaris]